MAFIYNPKIELLPGEEIKKIQQWKLKQQIRRVYEHSSLHRRKYEEAKIKPEEITLEDLQKLPLISREDLYEEIRHSDDPYGGRLCVSEEELLFDIPPPEWPLKGEPVMTAITKKDQASIVEQLTRQFVSAGINPGDRVQVQCWFWEAIGFAYTFSAALKPVGESVGQALGCLIMPQESYAPDAPRTIHLARFFKPTALMATFSSIATLESYLTHLPGEKKITVEVPVSEVTHFEVVKGEEFYITDLGYKTLIVRATEYEPLFPSPSQREEFKEGWHVDTYSMLDVQDNLFYATDCLEHNGLHVCEDAFIAEVVDKNGEPLGPGEIGKLVITNIFAEATPIIRYLTDIEVSFDEEQCLCGRTHIRIIPKNYK